MKRSRDGTTRRPEHFHLSLTLLPIGDPDPNHPLPEGKMLSRRDELAQSFIEIAKQDYHMRRAGTVVMYGTEPPEEVMRIAYEYADAAMLNDKPPQENPDAK